jgi:chorismate lyase / 3-hydroxybenzoate synthase
MAGRCFGIFPASTFVRKGAASRAVAGRHILGVLSHDTSSGDPTLDGGHPQLRVHTARTEQLAFDEVWGSERPVRCGDRAGLHWGYDGDFLFAAGRIAPCARYTDATRTAYLAAFDLAADFDCGHLVRMWNYVTDINGDNADGLEIYRDFCRGRAEAFDKTPFDFELPAATAVGALSGGIAFCLLAARAVDRINIENPRQMPAYQYPRRYGPRAPSFPRATLLRTEKAGCAQIFISGTASVLGHETVHSDDVRRQCAETFANLAALLGPSNLAKSGLERGYDLRDLTGLKVYARRAGDIDLVRGLCAQKFSPHAEVAFLNVDLCRPELLVEIEGVVQNHDPCSHAIAAGGVVCADRCISVPTFRHRRWET